MKSGRRPLSPFLLQFDAMSFQVALSHHTILCHVMACNASPMQSYDISRQACQCDTAWCIMQSFSLDPRVLSPSTCVMAKQIHVHIATDAAPRRQNLARSRLLLTRPRQKWQAIHHTETGLSLHITNPRDWLRLLPSMFDLATTPSDKATSDLRPQRT